ncbi:MAG: hypothetical protein ACRBB6_03890 [Neptuniibacter sp.]
MHADLLARQVRSGITGTYGRIKNDLSTGTINEIFPHDWKLSAFTGSQQIKGRADWLTVDLSQEYEYAIPKNEQQRVEEKYLTERQKVASTDKLEERIKKLEQQNVEQTSSQGSIEERLRKLQALYNSGTLPEEVYLDKVRSIMSEL